MAKEAGRTFRYCFLTETTSVGQIRRKMIQFTGEYVTMLESGEKDVIDSYVNNNYYGQTVSMVGSHYVMLSAPFLTFCSKHPFDLVILDESSVIKNKDTDMYKSAKALFRRTDRKVMLNATPLETNLFEFYNQLDLCEEGYMPSITHFRDNYCVTDQFRTVIGYKNAEFFQELIMLRYIARTRGDVGAERSDNEYATLICELTSIQKERMKKTSLYQMMGDYPTGVFKDIPFTPETTTKLSALLAVVKEWTSDFDKTPILIYCRFVEAQASIKMYLEEEGYNVAILNGKTPKKERTAIVERFNTGSYSIIITNVQKGIDLTGCDHLILYSIDYNPQKMVQIEGRITREEDIKHKRVVLLVANGKERKYLEETLKWRVEASMNFSVTDDSLVLDALWTGGNREIYSN
jgi:SNF2 family DNA or RNA helicase